MRVALLLLAVFAGWMATWSMPRADVRASFLKHELVELALDQLRSPGSFDVTVGAVEDAADGRTRLLDVQVSDGTGTWMTVDRLAFAWQPKRLLAGELAISDLDVTGVTVTRAPAAEAEWPELEPQPSWQQHVLDWPRAPIALALDRIRLQQVDIREGVLPQAVRFDAEGRLHDRDDVQVIALTVRRTDAVAGTIELESRRDFAAGTLRLALSAREAAGGLLAAGAGFPADAPAHLELTGDGPPDDWRLQFEATVARVLAAEGQAAVDYAGALTVDAAFALRPGPAMDRDLQLLLGEEARLTVAVTERSAGQFDVAAAELTAEAVSLRLSGMFATAAGRTDLAVSLAAEAPSAALVDGLAFDRLTFDGALTGNRRALTATGRLAVDAPDSGWAGAARVGATAEVTQVPAGARFTLAGSAEGLRVAHLAPAAIGTATLHATGTLRDRRLTLEAADLRSRLVSGQASGRYDLAGGEGELAVSFETPDLLPFSGEEGPALRGALAARADIRLANGAADAEVAIEATGPAAGDVSARRAIFTGRVSRAGRAWAFDLTGGASDLFHGDLPRSLTTELDMTFRGSLQDDSLHVAVLQLESPLIAAEARGDVDVAARTIRAAYRLAVPDLARVGDAYGWPAAGALEATGRATGDAGSPELAGAVTITDGVFDGRPYGRIGLTHAIRLGDPVTGPVEMTVREAWLGDAAASARVRLDPDQWHLEGIRASLPSATLASDVVTIAPDTWLVDGSGKVVSPDLGPLAAIAGFSASGAAEGAFAFRSRSGRQAMEATVEFAEAEVPGLSFGHAVLDVAVRDLAGGHGLDLRLSGRSGTVAALAVDSLSVTAAGALAALTFSGEAEGALGAHPVELAVTGQAARTDGPTLITVEAASAWVGQEHLALGRPVEMRIDPGGGVAVGELDLRLAGGGWLGGTGNWQADGLQGHLSGTRVPLTLLGHLAEVPAAAGSLDIEAAFDTRRRGARAEIEARARDIVLTGVEAEQALAAELSGHWDGARLNLRAVLRGGFGEPAEARLTLPVRVGDDGLPRLFRQDAIDGSLSWRGAMADLWQLLPPSAHVVEGDVDLRVRVAGTVDAPRLSGHAELSRGRYDHVDAGLALVDVRVAAAMTDTAVIKLHGSASDGGEGRVAVDATLHWDVHPTIEAELRVEQAALLQRDDVTARVSGAGRLQGPWSNLVFRGEFAVHEAAIRLTDVTPAAAVELDGVRLAHAAEEPETVAGHRLALDLTVRADRAVFIRGRGLESEWDLALRATGDVSAPVLSGAVRKIRGRLDLLGKPFELTRGDITFDGAAGLDPVIGVSLEREEHDVQGGIYVDGRLSSPRVRFGSRTGLAPDEVLPRLLFGASQQSLSGAQALQLSLGVARLLGHGPGLQDRLREAVGVDVLTVSGATEEDAAVTVGQNLGDRVFVGAEQRIGTGQSSIIVEVEVMENVIVDSRMEAGQGANVGMSWRRDY
ncbi:MAG: translocation/assembly module TamB [Rhodospirillales bacterium]|nr:translocation/assembly module TamB [Rhodospirillales bacterium]